MRKIFVIGIGTGSPEHLTLQAVDAIAATDVFFFIDKGTAPQLLAVREALLRRHATDGHRIVVIPDVERDRDPIDYQAAVDDWHRRRAQRIGQAIADELAERETGAFLVWGDPSLYDSTLRVLDDVAVAGVVTVERRVVPGITSVQALAAAHGVVLHGVGEPVLVTTGRRLDSDFTATTPAVLVMLDGECAFTRIDPSGVEIFWGAYLGTPDEMLYSGALAEVGEHIVAERAAARRRHGWIMDTYLLRRQHHRT